MTTATQHERPHRQAHRLAGAWGFRRGRGRGRRGFSSIFSILIISIGIATLLLVVNWTYLNLASRRTQDLAETLAWSAVYQLLDDELLEDTIANQALEPLLTYDQILDDIPNAENAITTPTTGLLDQNNAAAGPTLQVQAATDLTLFYGRVEDANSPVTGLNAMFTPAAGDAYNTLRVEIFRDPAGSNPVQLLIRGMGSPDAAKISGATSATLDSRVISLRPGTGTTPVAPVAIESSAWYATRPAGGDDTVLPNGRMELDVILKSTSSGGAANSALVNLMEAAAYDPSILEDQIRDSLVAGDLAGGILGPATASDPMPLLASEDTPAAYMTDIRDAFLDVAASNYPRRIFPIYSGAFAGTSVDIVGFIGARVLDAAVEDAGSGDRLRVRIEPDFIVHPTVVTAFEHPAMTPVPENIYIHKIRLTR